MNRLRGNRVWMGIALLGGALLTMSTAALAQYWGNQMLPKYGEALGTGLIGLNPAVRTVDIQGSHMVVADQYGVNIVDISNPAAPVLIGRTGIPRLSKRLTVSGRYIYVAESRGFGIVDFINPTAPTVVSFVDIGTEVTDIVRRDSVVFLSTVAGILAYNVTNPANPTLISSLTLGDASLGITIVLHPTQPLLYCGANTSPRQLFTVNVANPQNMQVVHTASLPAGGTVWSPPLVSGNRLYVIETIGVDAFDISTPTQPAMLYSQSPAWGSMYSAVLKDTLLFTAHWQTRWSVISVASPSSAQLLRSYDSIAVFGEGNGITKLHGNYLFLANFGKTASDIGWRVRIIDISNPLSASVVGSVASPSEGFNEAHEIFQRGGNTYAIVAQKNTIQHRNGQTARTGFLRILDVTNPSAPTVLSTLDLPHNMIAVTVAESVAVARGVTVSSTLGQWENWLYLLNIADLDNPVVLNQTRIQNNTQWVENQPSMAFFEGKLYVLDKTALNVYSVAGSTFALLGSTNVANANPLRSFRLRRVGNQILAYIAAGGGGSLPGGFMIYNVTNPAGMFLMSAFDTPGHATDVQLQGGYAFVTDGTGGVWVFDISNNFTVPVTSVASFGEARQCALENNLLFVRTIQGSNIYLQVFDVSNPAAPVSKGTYLSDGTTNFPSLSHKGRRLYLSQEYVFSIHRPLFNFRPLPFPLRSPRDTSTVTDSVITFVWGRSEDANDDTITYRLRLWRSGWDTTVAGTRDTTLAFRARSLSQGVYNWTVLASDAEFQISSPDTFRFTYITTGVETETSVPKEFALHQNYPNPFNPSTTLKFDVPEESVVQIEVFNVLGQLVRTLKHERVAPARYTLQWDGTDDRSVGVSSGIYIARMTAQSVQKSGASFSRSIKLLLMK
jgi:hypothetical protein